MDALTGTVFPQVGRKSFLLGQLANYLQIVLNEREICSESCCAFSHERDSRCRCFGMWNLACEACLVKPVFALVNFYFSDAHFHL